jgi:ABC-2 type transport system permease protein
VTGVALGAVGLLLSTAVRQLENFAGIMNFVIFPTFFLSSALYPLSNMRQASQVLWQICSVNPFTSMVELIRFAFYARVEPEAVLWTLLTLAVSLVLAVRGYSPAKGMMRRRVGGAE